MRRAIAVGRPVTRPPRTEPGVRRVGSQRVIVAETFPTASLRTARDPFGVKQLASGRTRNPSVTIGSQFQYGYSHLTYRMAALSYDHEAERQQRFINCDRRHADDGCNER